MDTTVRNRLKGKVLEVKPGKLMTEITVELVSGEKLVSAIAKGVAVNLDLKPGSEVMVVVKSIEVQAS